MSNQSDKPKLLPEVLIKMMQNEKGIKFVNISEKEAIDFLSNHNNYMRVAAYRKNYDKYPNGFNKGKYIDLDFAYLKELSTIDMHLRFFIIKMCLDIEHDIKIQLINDIVYNNNEDGYTIVTTFLNLNDIILKHIAQTSNSSYSSDLVNKYFHLISVMTQNCSDLETHIVSIDCPVWVLVEILSFGDFLKFYTFYYQNHLGAHSPIDSKILNSVRNLRNACAHNNSLLHNLRKGQSNPNAEISQFVSRIQSIKLPQRQKKLTSQPIYELVCLFYTYSLVVSHDVKEKRIEELKNLFKRRFLCHANYFRNQSLIKSSYDFVRKIVDTL